LVAYLTALRAISAASAVHYSCIDWRSIDMLIGAIRCVGGALLDICTWAKSQAGRGAFYRSQTEFIAVFQFGDAKKGNNINLKIGGRNRSNLWPYADANVPNRPRSKEPTPGSKPVRLIADAILDSTRRGDIIFDAFLTSGSTLIAAEETGRVCHGVEIRPTHVDVVIRRWQAFTGRQAQHVCTGLTFDELSTLRPSVKLLPLRKKAEA
jgi:DNA modification methylase